MSWVTAWQCNIDILINDHDIFCHIAIIYWKLSCLLCNSTIDKLFPDDIRIVPQISLCLPAPCTSVGWNSGVLFVNKSFFFLTLVECGLWRKRSSVGRIEWVHLLLNKTWWTRVMILYTLDSPNWKNLWTYWDLSVKYGLKKRDVVQSVQMWIFLVRREPSTLENFYISVLKHIPSLKTGCEDACHWLDVLNESVPYFETERVW